MMFKEEYGKRSHKSQNPGPSSLLCQFQSQEYYCSEENRLMDRELQKLKNTTLRRTNSKFFPSKCLNLALVSLPVLKEMKARSSSVEVTLETYCESSIVLISRKESGADCPTCAKRETSCRRCLAQTKRCTLLAATEGQARRVRKRCKTNKFRATA
jgi:hypothetical protein